MCYTENCSYATCALATFKVTKFLRLLVLLQLQVTKTRHQVTSHTHATRDSALSPFWKLNLWPTHTHTQQQQLLPRQFTYIPYMACKAKFSTWTTIRQTNPKNPKTPCEPRNFPHQLWANKFISGLLLLADVATIFYAKSSKQFLKIRVPNGDAEDQRTKGPVEAGWGPRTNVEAEATEKSFHFNLFSHFHCFHW